MGDTSMRCSDELLDELHARSERGETYEEVVWRLIERVDELEEQLDDVDVEADDGRDRVDQAEPPAPSPEPIDEPDEFAVDVEAVDLPGSGETLEKRQEALREVYEYLRARGTVTPSEFEEALFEEYPAGYEAGGPRSWWKNAMYPGLKQLAEQDDRIVVPDSSGKWNYEA